MGRRENDSRRLNLKPLGAMLFAAAAFFALTIAHVNNAGASSASSGGDTSFTDEAVAINPFGSCSLAWNQYGTKQWSFLGKPCGYPSVTCFSETIGMDDSCQNPFPNTNLYHPDEQEIATYFDDAFSTTTKSAKCPVNVTFTSDWVGTETKAVDCPTTCFDCATMCRLQAASVAKKDTLFDPTLQGCNAWVFCTNPEGCKHGGKTSPAYSCTLKRIPLDNPSIQEELKARSVYSPDSPSGPPEGLVDKGSSGKGSDFVSGLCNVRSTCTNNATLADTCDDGCGNITSYACGGYPPTCTDGCLPSCFC